MQTPDDKIKDMIRSILPSKARLPAKRERQDIHRAERRQTNIHLSELTGRLIRKIHVVYQFSAKPSEDDEFDYSVAYEDRCSYFDV